MEDKDKNSRSDANEYVKPSLRVIDLVADEVLGTGCKTVSDVAPTGICGNSSCGTQVGS